MLKKYRKTLVALLCSIGIGVVALCMVGTWLTARDAQATVYSPEVSLVEEGDGYGTYSLTIPVAVTVPHSAIEVKLSSDENFYCDDKSITVYSSSTDTVSVDMGRWTAHEPEGSNKLWCSVRYCDPDGEWSDVAAYCQINW